MKEYECKECGKCFKQKCHWTTHTQNKKFPCVKNNNKNNKNTIYKISNVGSKNEADNNINILIEDLDKINQNELFNNIANVEPKKIYCKFCLRDFLYLKNLNKHIKEERCKVLKIQKQQKENIFKNLLTEDKIVNQTKKELNEIDYNENKKNDINKIDFLINQIKLLNDKLEEQKNTFKKELTKQKIEIELEIKKMEKEKIKIENEKKKIETEERLKIMTERFSELEKNNLELKKNNEKLQNKVNKIVNKNKINNTQNINNMIINNGVKLVNFGSEDLSKISHNVFIDTIKSQGAGLYNRAIDGIHFNKDYPENQNIYISDINRGKVMIYKNEKWIIDNWDNIFQDLLDKVIQFGYDKEQFLADCNYKLEGKKYNKQMIKNGIRWYKLLSDDEPDVDYFTLDPEDRPEIDDDTYNDYVEMQEFRKKHPKKETENNIKNKIKLNMYNKREIPIENYKKIECFTVDTILNDTICIQKK
jgi:hypothetical protein